MKPPEESEPRSAPGGRRPPEYVVVVSASDWVKEHSPPPEPTSGTPCTPAKTVTATPNPTHDAHPEASSRDPDHQRQFYEQRPQRAYVLREHRMNDAWDR
jgi:hypothetical protein